MNNPINYFIALVLSFTYFMMIVTAYDAGPLALAGLGVVSLYALFLWIESKVDRRRSG